MANDWIESSIGDQATLQRGFDITKAEQRPGLVPVVSSGGIASHHNRAAVTGPGVVLGRKGVVGSVYFVASDYWPHDTTLWVKDFHGNNPRFVYYFFRDLAPRLASMDVGSANPTLNRNHVHPIRVRWPKRRVQDRIAEILGTLDDKIELNRRTNETLESIARALFKSWFVNFDPVHAKAAVRKQHPNWSNAQISRAALPNMALEQAEIFPDNCVDSRNSRIPEGWIRTTLGDELDFLFGFAFKSNSFLERPPGIRLARGDNVKEGFFFWDSKTRYWSDITPELEKYSLQVGDVLIGMDGSKVGKNWVRVRNSDLPCLLVQRVARLRSKGTIGETMIQLLVSDSTFRDHIESVKTGTSIPHISGNQLRSFEVIRPPHSDNRLFEYFEAAVAPITKRIDANIDEITILSSQRDALLPKLLSAELKFS